MYWCGGAASQGGRFLRLDNKKKSKYGIVFNKIHFAYIMTTALINMLFRKQFKNV